MYIEMKETTGWEDTTTPKEKEEEKHNAVVVVADLFLYLLHILSIDSRDLPEPQELRLSVSHEED